MTSVHRAELAFDSAAQLAANHFNPYDEPVEAGLVPACCHAGLKMEAFDFGTCLETGYRDQGDRLICAQCREEAEPLILALAAPKPTEISRQQVELFQEVA